jgi:E3 ubiquitin-protein ligase SHPRH
MSLDSFNRTDSHEFTILLWDSTFANGVTVTATSTLELLETFAPLLETAASLSASKGSRKGINKDRILFFRCTLSAPLAGQQSLRLALEVRWLVGLSVFEAPGQRATIRMDLNVLSKYLPDDSSETSTPWALSDFYDAAHVPATTESISARIQGNMNETQLYPFQRRAVGWLLRREGVAFTVTGDLSPITDELVDIAPVSFRATQDAKGTVCYVSHLRGMVVLDPKTTWNAARFLRGGILAEEMGLGKTVELLALITHHKRKMPDGKIRDPYLGTLVTPSSATLIITPPSILEQWKQEITTHAPELKVFHYKGLPSASASESEHEEATTKNLLQFDIVLTTYNVLSKEIHFATPPPDRSLRGEKVHKRRTSPLVEISWWRVCLDEAQMVESGVSQAATVARIIPRCNAWAVSGTPLRKDVQDLRGLLIFLRYEPYASSKKLWGRLDKPSFRAIFNQIALRHTKDKIRNELSLPPQKRVVITVPFTAIEEQNYSEMIRQMCQACFLSQEGIPLRDDRGPEHPEVVERMREWLVRLRQTCLHAHVGRRNRKALGAKNGPLRTVDEVLEVMIEQNDTSLKAEARELILVQMIRAHIQANAKDMENRSALALPHYHTALKSAQDYVKICRNELALEKERMGTTLASKGAPDEHSEDEEDDEQGDKLGRVAVLQRNLRSFLELEHACHFFIGNMYYQIHSNENITEPGSKSFHRLEQLESKSYDNAKEVRKEILRQPQGRAQSHMKKIKPEPPSAISEIDELPDQGGIESRRILEMMDNVTNVLNVQVDQLRKWRSKIVDILTSPLVDQDENKIITGDEYEDSTKVQDELYVYIMALRTITADRNTAINGLYDNLVEHELQDALRRAREKDEAKRGHAPELVLEIGTVRQKLKPKESDGSLKGVISATRSLITTLQWGADAGDVRAQGELAIAKKHLQRIQAISTEQEKAIAELEREQDLFRATMNQRLEFYRQLQHISDTVAPWREEMDKTFDVREYNIRMVEMAAKEKSLAGWKTKHAYLTNLRRENEEKGVKHECIICQDEFEVGVLTSCGHKVSPVSLR